MSQPVKAVRAYRSDRRRQQADGTRTEILAAARDQFTERGYGATSMADLAAAAGVAVQTVYAVFGSKGGILIALLDLIDQIGGVAANSARMSAGGSPRELLAGAVHLTRDLNEQAGDLIAMIRSASASEPDVAAAFAEGMGRHRAGAKRLAQGLARSNALRTGLGEAEAAALIGTMTSPDSYATLTEEFGRSFDAAEALILGSLERCLFDG